MITTENLLTTEELLEELEERDCPISKATLYKYRSFGLVPYPLRKGGREGYYERSLIDLIQKIKENLKEGFSLKQIAEAFKKGREPSLPAFSDFTVPWNSFSRDSKLLWEAAELNQFQSTISNLQQSMAKIQDFLYQLQKDVGELKESCVFKEEGSNQTKTKKALASSKNSKEKEKEPLKALKEKKQSRSKECLCA